MSWPDCIQVPPERLSRESREVLAQRGVHAEVVRGEPRFNVRQLLDFAYRTSRQSVKIDILGVCRAAREEAS